MGKAIRWTLLLVVLVIFSSGAVAFYTVFFRPSKRSSFRPSGNVPWSTPWPRLSVWGLP